MEAKNWFEIGEVIRTKRKTVAISVEQTLKLKIKAPKHISDTEILNIIEKHKKWILKRIEILKQSKNIQKSFNEGEKYLLLGRNYELKIADTDFPVGIKGDFLIVNSKYSKNVKETVLFFYKLYAKEFFSKKVNEITALTGHKFKTLKISNAKTRWGSCSSFGNINLSWRLIMAPESIIDYVIIHELSHLKEMNHSSRFWKEVEKYIPDHKKRRLWLKQNGHLFNIP